MSKSKRKKKCKNEQSDGLLFLKSVDEDKNICVRDLESFANVDFPLFSFRWLSSYSIEKCNDPKFFLSYLMRLQKLSELGWKEIRLSDRHSFGMEKIPVDAVKPKKLPEIVTPDVEKLDVFRATGNNLPMVGLQEGKIFHVFFIEASFGDVYSHD